MDSIIESFSRALYLILHLDRELLGIILLSLRVSGTALLAATLIGLPFSALLGFKKFPLRGFVISMLNTLMGLPPVVVGLFVTCCCQEAGRLVFSLCFIPLPP